MKSKFHHFPADCSDLLLHRPVHQSIPIRNTEKPQKKRYRHLFFMQPRSKSCQRVWRGGNAAGFFTSVIRYEWKRSERGMTKRMCENNLPDGGWRCSVGEVLVRWFPLPSVVTITDIGSGRMVFLAARDKTGRGISHSSQRRRATWFLKVQVPQSHPARSSSSSSLTLTLTLDWGKDEDVGGML